MILPPISVIVGWPKANYEHPTVIGHYLIPVLTLFMVMTTITVSFRLYSRACFLHSLSWDDWLIIPATVSTIETICITKSVFADKTLVFQLAAIMLSIANLITLRYGWGKHIWDVPVDVFGMARFWSFIAQIMFTSAAALTKLSILLFYTRFCTTKKTKWAIRASMAFVGTWYVAWMIVIFLQCIPLSAYWHYPKPTDYCINYEDGLHVVSI